MSHRPSPPQSMMPQQGREPLARRDASAMSMGGPGGMGTLGGMGGMGGMGGGGGPDDGDGAANVEISPEQVQTIRRMVAENRSLTGPLIESLKQTDPKGAAHLTPDDPDGILRYFSELGNDDAPSGSSNAANFNPPPAFSGGPPPRRPSPPPGSQAIEVTPAEHASIQRVSSASLIVSPGWGGF